MQQPHLVQQPHMTTYSGTTITTELIQKYLDENKQLILAILDNQNLGKLNECAQYQTKLQQNLMFLAAIADAQPQAPSPPTQVKPGSMMQSGQQYVQQHIPVHLGQMPMQTERNTLPYMQQAQIPIHPSPQQQQQQQFLQSQPGLLSTSNNGIHLITNDSSIVASGLTSAGNFNEFGHGGIVGGSGDNIQTNIGLGGEIRGNGTRSDSGVSINAQPASGDGGSVPFQATENAEPLYLKASNDGSQIG